MNDDCNLQISIVVIIINKMVGASSYVNALLHLRKTRNKKNHKSFLTYNNYNNNNRYLG